MARYIGGSLVVAAVATIYGTVTSNHREAGASAADALAAGLSRSALLMALISAAGVVLALLVRHQRRHPIEAIHRAAAAAGTSHTIPTQPVTGE